MTSDPGAYEKAIGAFNDSERPEPTRLTLACGHSFEPAEPVPEDQYESVMALLRVQHRLESPDCAEAIDNVRDEDAQ